MSSPHKGHSEQTCVCSVCSDSMKWTADYLNEMIFFSDENVSLEAAIRFERFAGSEGFRFETNKLDIEMRSRLIQNSN